ncbi:DUF4886 domain-containing protein [Puniceicoccus vermicola]|uniref:DUF4886 domain-containing protein n=1 Tax=Puniceicoccus vermicola TaxID=388746 RepID=A0A7X1B1F7_9BACT|nr:DUF4886 domain-containing protein [Puniceicoccus vermicola]MBC2603807.1 DUF4886 domain-containing protein [Puniceicoccus vermicola]
MSSNASPDCSILFRLLRPFVKVSFRSSSAAVASVLLLAVLVSSVSAEGDDGKIRILGVGNSFTRNAMRFLPQIVASEPSVEADVAYAYIGGCPLDKHVKLAEAHEANPEDGKKYSYNMNGKTIQKNVSLKEMLQDGIWDYVTIQQVSTKSYKIETYYPYAEKLIDYIHQYAPDAEIVIHETWPHSIDSYRYTDWGLDPKEMYEKLHAAYTQVAEEYGLKLIPVGTAFQNAKESPVWDYEATDIDVKTLVYPEDKDNLPDQSKSLHNVFFWRKNKEGEWYVGNDGFHANQNGEYLGGLIWNEFFFGIDPTTVTFAPKGMTEEQKTSLQEIAKETVSEFVTVSAEVAAP